MNTSAHSIPGSRRIRTMRAFNAPLVTGSELVEMPLNFTIGAPQLPSTPPVAASGVLLSRSTPHAGPACAEISVSHAARLTARAVYQTLLGFAFVSAPAVLSRK